MRTALRDRGGKTGLLVIDVQYAVVENGWDRDRVITRIGAVIEAARQSETPVVYVQHEIPGTPFLGKGTDGWQIVSKIAPEPTDPVVDKLYPDAFAETTLEAILALHGIGHLIITGAHPTPAYARQPIGR